MIWDAFLLCMYVKSRVTLTSYFKYSGFVVLLEPQKGIFFSHWAEREITPTLQGCEQSVWLSLTYFFLLLVSSVLFFFSLFFLCLPLSFCLSVTFLLSLSGPQNKDSRESLPYDGEEKEVREKSFETLLMCDSWSVKLSWIDWYVCVYIFILRNKSVPFVCERIRSPANRIFVPGIFCQGQKSVHLGDPSSTCCVCVI